MWKIQEKYSTQDSIEYNEDVEYSDPLYTYNGKEITNWTKQTKS